MKNFKIEFKKYCYKHLEFTIDRLSQYGISDYLVNGCTLEVKGNALLYGYDSICIKIGAIGICIDRHWINSIKEGSKICPICGKEYDGYPAISRKDNETEICSQCGQDEAMEAFNNFYGLR